jgi:hypothetical protein
MARLVSSPGRSFPVLAINLGTLAVLIVWLVVAAYGFAYLVSR